MSTRLSVGVTLIKLFYTVKNLSLNEAFKNNYAKIRASVKKQIFMVNDFNKVLRYKQKGQRKQKTIKKRSTGK